ncbi:hypothetical protein FCG67_19810 [Rhodococcus oryzae]|uniref:Uncharacterized protein n=1 Tax=Rhodococcus oryzae TaxID=2571143 RepID=A0ABY2RFX7_9NOCA|nr:hypothetical protein [Rhodococcus oryzae]TJZ75833.1 hypothetical protein FCG67_19810 [Rhodococcus oryzae]
MTAVGQLDRRIHWEATGDPREPHRARLDGQTLSIRLGDFPADALYTLLLDGEVVAEFDDWPALWVR